MREVLLIESIEGGGVRVLARSDDQQLLAWVQAEMANQIRRNLAAMEPPRLVKRHKCGAALAMHCCPHDCDSPEAGEGCTHGNCA